MSDSAQRAIAILAGDVIPMDPYRRRREEKKRSQADPIGPASAEDAELGPNPVRVSVPRDLGGELSQWAAGADPIAQVSSYAIADIPVPAHWVEKAIRQFHTLILTQDDPAAAAEIRSLIGRLRQALEAGIGA